MDFHYIEKKWQKRWIDEQIFQPEVDPEKQKFFCTFPYPYVNGLPHVGHLFTIMRVEAFARYKRMRGYNVLFPQAWHCTGSPIVAAAKRIEEGESKQIKILKDMGISDSELHEFIDPVHWIKYFPPKYKDDLQAMGLSVDWRREFITTSLNPHYDAFIKWQFLTLKKKNFVVKGKFPVVWCPKELCPVSDHSRMEGEGETPQEWTLVKYLWKEKGIIIPALTLRPETIYGVTNLWVHPLLEYVQVQVNSEVWIIANEMVQKLIDQDYSVTVLGPIKGSELIGKYVLHPETKMAIPLLPAHFVSSSMGSGIVMSVPSDSPDDWMALSDLKKNEHECKKHNLSFELVKGIEPIPVITSADLGDLAAVKVCQDMHIQNQHEREKLEIAKKLVYKKGFYEGVMNANSKIYEGLKVEVAKEKIKKDMFEKGSALAFYELTGKVICRCLTQSVVKIVADQWFVAYGDSAWKEKAHACLSQLKLYPEKARQQFDYVIDWLREWACTREEGLGTRLPWDEKWLIESLSDSTLYMAYYTVAHKIKKIPVQELTPAFFDYVFLGAGMKPNTVVDPDELRSEFIYWYPVDFRNSGKDLIQNHLTFFMFNHVAIFPEDKWPKGIGVNGWVTVDGQKMSKSLGNVIPVRHLMQNYGADASRFTILNGAEGMEDPNWDSELAKTMGQRLASLIDFCKENYDKGRTEYLSIDSWFSSEINRIILKTTEEMEETNFRTAMQFGYYEMQRIVKRYFRRTNNTPHKELMNFFIEVQLLLLVPFTPHVCEEIWHTLDKKGFISKHPWPIANESTIDQKKIAVEEMIDQILGDVATVKKLAQIEKPKEILIIVPELWKYNLYAFVQGALFETRDVGKILKKVMEQDYLKKHGQDIAKILPKVIDRVQNFESTNELLALQEAKDYFEKEFSCTVHILEAEKTTEPKAKQAMPGKMAIVVK